MPGTQVVKAVNFGGAGGGAFDDFAAAAASGTPINGISSIAVRPGTFVNGLAATYTRSGGGTFSASHGGSGTPATITLAPDERLIGIRGRSGDLIDQLTFLTRTSTQLKTYGPYGGGGGNPFEISGDIVAFYGRSGANIDNLGVYIRVHYFGPFGGGGGSPFEDPIAPPGLVSIRQIVIRSGAYVDAIATTYVRRDGSTVTQSHGGGGGEAHVINFHPGEHITGVFGRSGAYLDNIGFMTTDALGIRRSYGPFGGGGGTPFVLNRDVISFAGRSGGLIDAIGFYTT